MAGSKDHKGALSARDWQGGFGAAELDVVVADRNLEFADLDPNRSAYNPSMVPFGDGAVMAFRSDGPAHGATVDMRLGFVVLDGNFAVQSKTMLMDLRPDGDLLHTAEDPRLVWHNESLYVLFNQREHDYSYFPRVMHVARIGMRDAAGGVIRKSDPIRDDMQPISFVVETVKKLLAPPPIPRQRVEKNWTPYSLAGDLWLMYQTNPPIALQLTDDMLNSDSSHLQPLGPVSGAPPVRYGFGEMRGGTGAAPAAPYTLDPNAELDPNMGGWPEALGGPKGAEGNSPWAQVDSAPEALSAMDPNAVYESFFHAQRIDFHKQRYRHIYTIGYYAFRAEPPFRIARMLAVPLAVPGADVDDPYTFTCSYPGGFVRRGPHYHVAYGRADKAIAILTLNANALLARTTHID